MKLAADDEPGRKLVLRGTVLSDDCRTPLPGTMIEIWQADDNGHYDKKRPGDFLEASPPFHLRGTMKADAQGRYEIQTVIPGAYPIPPGCTRTGTIRRPDSRAPHSHQGVSILKRGTDDTTVFQR